MNNLEMKLKPLTLSDADFRAYLAKGCESAEQLDCLNQQTIETLRSNYLDGTFDDLEYESEAANMN
jgi:hypothetical protein